MQLADIHNVTYIYIALINVYGIRAYNTLTKCININYLLMYWCENIGSDVKWNTHDHSAN